LNYYHLLFSITQRDQLRSELGKHVFWPEVRKLLRTICSGPPSFDLQENCLANPQEGGQSFFNDAVIPEDNQQFKMMGDTTGNFEFDAVAAPQASASSAFTPLDLATSFEGAGQLVLGTGNLHGQDDGLQTFDNSTGHSQMGGSEAAQSSLCSIYSLPSTYPATLSNNMAPRARSDIPRIGPINVSFFFRTTLTRRTV